MSNGRCEMAVVACTVSVSEFDTADWPTVTPPILFDHEEGGVPAYEEDSGEWQVVWTEDAVLLWDDPEMDWTEVHRIGSPLSPGIPYELIDMDPGAGENRYRVLTGVSPNSHAGELVTIVN